jgi:hypothetical protein
MSDTTRGPRFLPRWAWIILGFAAAYLLSAYLIMPFVEKAAGPAPEDESDCRLTHTTTGHPGDPLNIQLIGNEEDVLRAMAASGWDPADPITFRSTVQIALDTATHRPDDRAPVSTLYLFGRRQDLAFEKPAGRSPRTRHHVRFWRMIRNEAERPVWIGSAAFDSGVEFSRTTGEITHHISPDVDTERDLLVADLVKAEYAAARRWVQNYHAVRKGRNGAGDPWFTDGRLAVVLLTPTTPSKPAPLP